MACEQTEYRLLLHAHHELGAWERWYVNWHLRFCPCCREVRARFERERWALASCLSSPLMRQPAVQPAAHLTSAAPAAATSRLARLRPPALVVALLLLLLGSIALGYVQVGSMPGGRLYHSRQPRICAPPAGLSQAAPAAARAEGAGESCAPAAKPASAGVASRSAQPTAPTQAVRSAR
jgi:hypothetical protein